MPDSHLDASDDAAQKQPAPRDHSANQMIQGLWYVALPSGALKPGQMEARTLLGQPLLFARRTDGGVFAVRDQCPHRGTPLRFGTFDGETVACPYHGWRFNGAGVCTAIPSLVSQDDINLSRIKCGAFACAERQGLIWIYLPAPGEPADQPPPEPELFPGFETMPAKAAIRLVYNAPFDEAAFGMMDAAHIPFVHRAWWMKRKPTDLRLKEKNFEPYGLGWRMKPHDIPNLTPFHRLLGGQVKTEIQLRLPGFRIEIIYGERHRILNLLAITPIDDQRTQMLQALWWTMPGLDFLSPLVAVMAKRFLRQDADIIDKQNLGLKFSQPRLMIDDADTQMKWWLQVKREWASRLREDRPFVNPVQPATLRFRS